MILWDYEIMKKSYDKIIEPIHNVILGADSFLKKENIEENYSGLVRCAWKPSSRHQCPIYEYRS